MAEQKKGIFARLFGQKPKSNCCCNVEVEEIPDEDQEKAPQQARSTDRGSSCCGPAPKARSDGDRVG